MKKFFLMAVAAMMVTMNVNAQSVYEDTKNEVGISLGAWSNSDILNAFETLGVVIVGVKTDGEKFLGPISVEYFRRLKPWLGVGGIAVYGQMKQDFYMNGKSGGKDGEIKNHYFTLMPAVKFDWLRKEHFGMYSKLACGATLRNEKIIYNDKSYKSSDDTELHVNWQVSLLGLEAGGEQLRGFIEIGSGEQGIMLIGLRYKF